MKPVEERRRRKLARTGIETLLNTQVPLTANTLFGGSPEQWQSKMLEGLQTRGLCLKMARTGQDPYRYYAAKPTLLKEFLTDDLLLNGLLWPASAVLTVPTPAAIVSPEIPEEPTEEPLSPQELSELCLKALAGTIQSLVETKAEVKSLRNEIAALSALRTEIADLKELVYGIANETADKILNKLI